jgi:glycosyltransferase involved in cell wall biosynthesis
MPDAPALPPTANEPISLVLTAHNDEAHLDEVLGAWFATLDALGRDYEILLVNDGSSDRTGILAEARAAQSPRLRVLGHAQHRGDGAALRTGMTAARHPLLVQAPCDRQYVPAELARFLGAIDKVHLVSGYRVWQPVPLWLRVVGWCYRLFVGIVLAHPQEPLPGWLGWRGYAAHALARVLFGLRVGDVGCAFRLHRRQVFERLPIQADGDFALVEVLAKANFLGCVMTEEPVTHRPREREAREKEQRRRQAWREARKVFLRPEFAPGPATQARAAGEEPPR